MHPAEKIKHERATANAMVATQNEIKAILEPLREDIGKIADLADAVAMIPRLVEGFDAMVEFVNAMKGRLDAMDLNMKDLLSKVPAGRRPAHMKFGPRPEENTEDVGEIVPGTV